MLYLKKNTFIIVVNKEKMMYGLKLLNTHEVIIINILCEVHYLSSIFCTFARFVKFILFKFVASIQRDHFKLVSCCSNHCFF